MRILFFHHQQRRPYREEPGYLELFRPFVRSGLADDRREFVYQTLVRSFVAGERPHAESGHQAYLRASARLVPIFEQAVETAAPDLIVYPMTWHWEAIHPGIFARIKERFPQVKLFTQLWDYNESDSMLMGYEREIVAVSDLVAITDSRARCDAIRSRSGPYADWVNTDAVHWLPTRIDAELFCSGEEPKRYDVALFGSSEGVRSQIADALKLRYGERFHRFAGFGPDDEYLPPSVYARRIRESRVVVNTQTLPERIQIKGRAKEVLCCGSYLIEQDNPESRAFLEGSGTEFFSSLDDLFEKIDAALPAEAEREARAATASTWYRKRNDPHRYVSEILHHTGLA